MATATGLNMATATGRMAKGPTVRMRLTEEEARLVRARRGAEPPHRPPVISGFREPRTIPELVEVVRAFLDSNFRFMIDEHGDREHRLDIQGGWYPDDLRSTSIYFHEDADPGDTFHALTPDEVQALTKYRAARPAG